MYDKADRSAAGARLLQNDCHPKGHDNDLALKCPGYLQNKQIRKIVLLFKLLELQWRQAPPCSSWDTVRVAPFIFSPCVKSLN